MSAEKKCGHMDSKIAYEHHQQLAKIQIASKQLEIEVAEEFRKKVGLADLERIANVCFGKIQRAVIELVFCREMDKNKFVMDEAELKVASRRIEYDSVCKKIFKVCIKHGLKSEHLG